MLFSFSAIALVACTTPVAPLRDPGAPLGATTRFEADHFAGAWRVVASTAPPLQGPLDVQAAENRVILTGALSGSYAVTAPGVLTDASGTRLVVMWVDESFRTAAIGSEDGRFAALLGRETSVPADKRAAAFDIFDFYGWDVSRIEDRS